MDGETLVWFLSTILLVPLLCADSQYECGAHGKFEYCIDGIPGCVVGCHCHPGYYFDTDTKICEPNIKLTQDFRRNYNSQPKRRIQMAPMTPSPESYMQPATQNAVDEKIDEIAKDADDLGDWLYNQFFKTIENQVINKTQDEQLPPTRRSGDILLKPERRTHKRKGKKKKRPKGLKGKLLRITEDDSLFNSGSGSSIEDSSDSSESDSSYEKTKRDKHGHKEIIIFNKKPLPPLPSFIFLPNMETPYYPPIGLPPPPVVPMYPMVPVPPVLPGIPICAETEEPSSTTTEETTNSPKSTTTTTELTSAPSIPTTEENIEPDTELLTEEPGNLRNRNKKRKKNPIGRINNETVPQNNMMKERRKKLLKRLREKFNRKNKLENYFIDQYHDSEALIDEGDPSAYMPVNNMRPSNDAIYPKEDVDFKYLAELIHKTDLNKTLNMNNVNNIPNNSPNLNNFNHPKNIETPSRRNYYPVVNNNIPPVTGIVRQRSRMEDPNDSFYTNLGKQIATMIRKIDSKGEHEVNIEIEGDSVKPQPQSNTSPVFNENNYASRSYWERSVRSPLKYLNSFKKEMDYLKKSNEDLFSLENQVALAASTKRKLNLNDLETIVSKFQNVGAKPKRNSNRKTYHSKTSFKLNLLPENAQTIHTVGNTKVSQSLPNTNSYNIKPLNTRRIQPDPATPDSFLLSNFRQLSPDYYDPITNSGNGKHLAKNLRPTRKPDNVVAPTHQFSNFMPPFVAASSKPNINYQLSPMLIHEKKLKTYNNPYIFGKTLPGQFTGLTQTFVPYKNVEKPSYFHHEVQHFDFFDM